jgi:hypothetical protein
MAKKNTSNASDRLGTWIIALVLFLLAAGFFLCAYAGMESGTTFKAASPRPRQPRGSPLVYAGNDTREDHPGKFWGMEILFFGGGLTFAASGVKLLWDEYKPRQHHNLPQ